MCRQKPGLKSPPPVFGKCVHAAWSYSAYSFRLRQSGWCCYYDFSAVSYLPRHVPADTGAVTYHTPTAVLGLTWSGLIQSTLKKLISSISFNLAFGRCLWKFLQRRWHQLLSQLLCRSASLCLLSIWPGCVCVCKQILLIDCVQIKSQFMLSRWGGSIAQNRCIIIQTWSNDGERKFNEAERGPDLEGRRCVWNKPSPGGIPSVSMWDMLQLLAAQT